MRFFRKKRSGTFVVMIHGRIFLLFFLFFALSFFAQKSNRVLLYQGNEAFQKKDYATATEKFSEAVENNDNDFDALFNLGNTLYKDKKYSEAEALYSRASSVAKNKTDKFLANYNLGNARYKEGNLDTAEKAYREALKNNPHDEFARKNIQIIKSKRQKDNNNSNQEQNQKDNKNRDENQKESPNLNNVKTPQNGGNQGEQKGKGTPDNGKKDNENEKQPEIPNSVRKKILENLSEREKEIARKILNKPAYSEPRSKEKDW